MKTLTRDEYVRALEKWIFDVYVSGRRATDEDFARLLEITEAAGRSPLQPEDTQTKVSSR